MTTEEAIQRIINVFDSCKWDIDEGDEEARDMAIDALDKQTPKKPEIHTETIEDVYDIINCYTCPVCDNEIGWYHKYCDNCGQAVDWSEVDTSE